MNHQIEQWRQQLDKADFLEATERPNHYFKVNTPLTAFFLNLYVFDDYISIYYGCASTAFTRMKGCENSLSERGVSETDSCLRFYAAVRSMDEAVKAGADIQKVFDQYRGMEKDDLLEEIKEKRKGFLSQITLMLKPLGFRKKGNQWRRNISDNHVIYLWADKSSYSDTYRFHVAISAQNKNFQNHCYCTIGTIQPLPSSVFDCEIHISHKFDWQLHTHEDLTELIQRFLEMYVFPTQNGMETLGKEEYVWKGCLCQMDCCDHCWVEKNLKSISKS